MKEFTPSHSARPEPDVVLDAEELSKLLESKDAPDIAALSLVDQFEDCPIRMHVAEVPFTLSKILQDLPKSSLQSANLPMYRYWQLTHPEYREFREATQVTLFLRQICEEATGEPIYFLNGECRLLAAHWSGKKFVEQLEDGGAQIEFDRLCTKLEGASHTEEAARIFDAFTSYFCEVVAGSRFQAGDPDTKNPKWEKVKCYALGQKLGEQLVRVVAAAASHHPAALDSEMLPMFFEICRDSKAAQQVSYQDLCKVCDGLIEIDRAGGFIPDSVWEKAVDTCAYWCANWGDRDGGRVGEALTETLLKVYAHNPRSGTSFKCNLIPWTVDQNVRYGLSHRDNRLRDCLSKATVKLLPSLLREGHSLTPREGEGLIAPHPLFAHSIPSHTDRYSRLGRVMYFLAPHVGPTFLMQELETFLSTQGPKDPAMAYGVFLLASIRILQGDVKGREQGTSQEEMFKRLATAHSFEDQAYHLSQGLRGCYRPTDQELKVPEGLHAVRSKALAILEQSATESGSLDERTAAKTYIYDLAVNHPITQEISSTFDKVFARGGETVDRLAPESSFSALSIHLNDDPRSSRARQVLESLIYGKDAELSRKATAVVCQLCRITDSPDLRLLAQGCASRLAVGEREIVEGSADRKIGGFSGNTLDNRLKKVNRDLIGTVLKPLGEAVREIDPRGELHFAVTDRDLEIDDRPSLSLAIPWGYDLAVRLNQVENVEAIAAVAALLKEQIALFEEKTGIKVQLFSAREGIAPVSQDCFEELQTLRVRLNVTPSLYDLIASGESPSELSRYRSVGRVLQKDAGIARVDGLDLPNAIEEAIESKANMLSLVEDAIVGNPVPDESLCERIDQHREIALDYLEARSDSHLSLTQAEILAELDNRSKRVLLSCCEPGVKDGRIRFVTPETEPVAHLVRNVFENLDDIHARLTKFESHEVAVSEIVRGLELLLHAGTWGNGQLAIYLGAPERLRSKTAVIYPPKNEPFFSVIERVVIPALFYERVHFVVPQSWRKHGLPDMFGKIGIDTFSNKSANTKAQKAAMPTPVFGNIIDTKLLLSGDSKPEDRSHEWVEEEKFIENVAKDVGLIVYSGPSGEKKRKAYCKAAKSNDIVLMGASSGHNPIIISASASLEEAAEACVDAVIRNCGQDCTSPCSILVEGDETREKAFLEILARKVAAVSIGDYRNWTTSPPRVGKLGSASNETWETINRYLKKNADAIYSSEGSTPPFYGGDYSTVYPTIFRKPLEKGANFQKCFAPFFVVQRFYNVEQLEREFFSHQQYAPHAMYVSLFFTEESDYQRYSKMLRSLTAQVPGADEAITLHPEEGHQTLLRNATLNTPGMDRGYEPFGGYGSETKYKLGPAVPSQQRRSSLWPIGRTDSESESQSEFKYLPSKREAYPYNMAHELWMLEAD